MSSWVTKYTNLPLAIYVLSKFYKKMDIAYLSLNLSHPNASIHPPLSMRMATHLICTIPLLLYNVCPSLCWHNSSFLTIVAMDAPKQLISQNTPSVEIWRLCWHGLLKDVQSQILFYGGLVWEHIPLYTVQPNIL